MLDRPFGRRPSRLLAASLLCTLIAVSASLSAQARPAPRRDSAGPASDSARAGRDTTGRMTGGRRDEEEKPPVVTRHAITVGGETIRYSATTGMMPIRSDKTGITEGNIFYVYYAKEGANPATRPIAFIFNGGPGSASVWLHMGAFGPRKVRLNPDGTNSPPPYDFEDNPYTLLNQTDMVFIDPVGTGYSRATKPEYGPNFWGLDEDVKTVGEFIRLFLVRNQRWGSPKFIAGESYGTTRAAHLSGWLVDNGITLNGVALISAVLNFQASRQAHANDLAWIGYFPSYTAIAWYHKQLPPDLQALPLEQVLRQSEQWTDGDYLVALHKGARMTDAERGQALEKMSRLTGLSKPFLEANDLRVTLARFDHELLRDKKQMVGRLDGRFTAFAADPGAERNEFDPSDASIRNSFTPVWNDYARRELNYKSDDVYYILGGGIGPWKYPEGQGYPDVTPSLERAFARNPYMKVFVAMGYYDTATPYWAVEYTLSHLNISPEARRNITTDHFEAGHMMYIEDGSMKRLRRDLSQMIDAALRQPEGVVGPGGR